MENFVGLRFDVALKFLMPESSLRERRRLCDRGIARVDGRITSPAFKMRSGSKITLIQQDDEINLWRPKIIKQDNGIVAIDKPSGIPSAYIAGGVSRTIESTLQNLFPNSLSPYPKLLNRLDTGTSGIVLVATDISGENLWRIAGEENKVRKLYLCIVEGELPDGAEIVIDRAINTDNRKISKVLPSRQASFERRTFAKSFGIFEYGGVACSILTCTIIKGVRHQIRAHLSYIGHPLYGDEMYKSKTKGDFFLHHWQCFIQDWHSICKPNWIGILPPDIVQRINSLELWKTNSKKS